MSEQCFEIQSRYEIVRVFSFEFVEGEDFYRPCLRQRGHVGPHLIKRVDSADGAYVLWQDDTCDDVEEPDGCRDCRSEDPEDWCLAYEEITEDLAREYIYNPQLVEPGWKE